ncbi:MAG: DUF488 family protein [Sulfolobales archaeon]
MSERVVYTLGYDGRSLGEFLSLLEKFGVESVIDIRRWVVSRRRLEFSGESLRRSLLERGFEYHWFPELGGYRRFGVDIEDLGLAKCFVSEGFRAYATYIMSSCEIRSVLERVLSIVSTRRSVLICREKYPWRCHRKILSDYLVVRGFRVLHIIESSLVIEHRLSRCARLIGGEIVYL